jgi:hypothetical protein
MAGSATAFVPEPAKPAGTHRPGAGDPPAAGPGLASGNGAHHQEPVPVPGPPVAKVEPPHKEIGEGQLRGFGLIIPEDFSQYVPV